VLHRWRPYICPFEELLPLIPRASSVLDVGCGGGLLLFLLATADPAANATGLDVSASSIGFAQENLLASASDLQKRLRFMVLDATKPWPVATFDVVSLVDLLHHVPPAQQFDVVREAVSHLKPGGLLLYKDMADSPFSLAAANRAHDLLVAQQWIRYLPIEQMELWAEMLGLELIFSKEVRRYWYGHELRLFRKKAISSNNH
jgi:2-polyprenyl-3-methyl-5-hydroxy-6-metoxy-1,4-benzoquinol methylase